MYGFEVARRLREALPEYKIIFFSLNMSSDCVEESVKVGAQGYVFKTNAAADLIPAINAAAQGKTFFSKAD